MQPICYNLREVRGARRVRNDGRVGGARFLRKAVVKDNAGFANQRTFAVLAFIDRYTQTPGL